MKNINIIEDLDDSDDDYVGDILDAHQCYKIEDIVRMKLMEEKDKKTLSIGDKLNLNVLITKNGVHEKNLTLIYDLSNFSLYDLDNDKRIPFIDIINYHFNKNHNIIEFEILVSDNDIYRRDKIIISTRQDKQKMKVIHEIFLKRIPIYNKLNYGIPRKLRRIKNLKRSRIKYNL
ncbi:MAG TPA: hypothetical protein ENG48_12310 [Candidatus Atribacteria bacterium]|nr:hypothetical protein [Candidatus Atribacteria bacterium]